MNDNIKAFNELVKSDPEFGRAATKMELDELIETAENKGITLAKEDFQPNEGELSEDEVKNIAAAGGCGCVLGGGGGGTDDFDGNTYGCACVAYGQGGDGRANDANCACILTGAGSDDEQHYD